MATEVADDEYVRFIVRGENQWIEHAATGECVELPSNRFRGLGFANNGVPYLSHIADGGRTLVREFLALSYHRSPADGRGYIVSADGVATWASSNAEKHEFWAAAAACKTCKQSRALQEPC